MAATSLGIFQLHYNLMGQPLYMQSILTEMLCDAWLFTKPVIRKLQGDQYDLEGC